MPCHHSHMDCGARGLLARADREAHADDGEENQQCDRGRVRLPPMQLLDRTAASHRIERMETDDGAVERDICCGLAVGAKFDEVAYTLRPNVIAVRRGHSLNQGACIYPILFG